MAIRPEVFVVAYTQLGSSEYSSCSENDKRDSCIFASEMDLFSGGANYVEKPSAKASAGQEMQLPDDEMEASGSKFCVFASYTMLTLMKGRTI